MIILGAGEIVEKVSFYGALGFRPFLGRLSRVPYKFHGPLEDRPTPAKECTSSARREDAYSQSKHTEKASRLRARL